jgi:hypothetical protein
MTDRESKRSRFERLAEKRVNAARSKLRLIGNLANRHNYDYTDDHVRQIIEVLDGEIRRLRGKFVQDSDTQKSNFSFDVRKKGKTQNG